MTRFEQVLHSLPPDFDALRSEAHAEGFGMLDVLAADWNAGKVRFDRDGERLFAAYCDDGLAGIGGLTVDPFLPGAFRMRRFYVRRAFRRSGIGVALAMALLASPGGYGRLITVNAASGSKSFWEALGFVPVRAERHTHIHKGQV
jgi:GNAT superfamily N-acetyltransferase